MMQHQWNIVLNGNKLPFGQTNWDCAWNISN